MKLIYRILLGAAICVAGANADELPPLTVADATGEALAHNPGIAQAMAQWSAAKERVIQEGAWEDLQVSAMSRLARFIDIPRNGFTDQIASVSQIIPISGKNSVRARAAAAEAMMAYEDLRRSELDVTAAVRTAIYRLANARAQEELNRENLVLLKQIVGVSRLRYESGSQSAADVLAAETEAGKLLQQARELDQAVVAEEANLNVAMGRDAFSPVGDLDSADLPLKDLPLEQLRELMMANRPELKSGENKLEAEKARLQLAHRSWILDPTVTLQGQRYNSAGQGVSELDAGISFSIPWANERKYAAATREAAANVAAAEQALEASRLDALRLLRTTLEDLTTAQHHLRVSGDTLLKQARDGLKASEIGYEAGKVGLADWISAAQSVRQVEAMELEEKRDSQVAAATLEAVIGTTIYNTK